MSIKTTLRPFRHTTSGSRQWCAVNQDGQIIEFTSIAPDGSFRGHRAYFQRKMDVVAAIKAADAAQGSK